MHLIDASGNLRGQHDSPPASGAWPTTAWIPGQVVADPYVIPISTEAPTGDYYLELGLYDPVTGQRLPVVGPAGQVIGDHVTINGLHKP